LNRLMRNFDKDGAIEFCKGMINDLLNNRVDLSLLVITKGLSKKVNSNNDSLKISNKIEDDMAMEAAPRPNKEDIKDDCYGKKNMAHVALAEKMQLRDSGTAPSVGDRVSYVMIKGSKG